MEVNGMWSIVNIEKTLSPPPPLPPFHAPFPAAFPASFPAPFHASFPAPFYATFPAPLLAPFPVLSSVHCRPKKTKFYLLITLDNY